MEAKATWKGRLSFAGSANSGFTLPLGTDPSVGGDNDGFRPLELLAIGLAGCTAMDVMSILKKKRQEVTAFDVQVHTSHANVHPKVFTRATIEYTVSGRQIEEAALVRSIELSVTRYCPAHAMLSKAFPIEFKYTIFEEQESGSRQLVRSGIFTHQKVEINV